ncbi:MULTISPECIES: hypothetical protein [unclassified Streptomyces]|uniref:hypothetical protein n=1 Tax=unclassified Streptomyces TaxID=2593676 RepID=UPI00115F827D|nr:MULTISPECIES: hypothetical protein [unclassified Streptomyces]
MTARRTGRLAAVCAGVAGVGMAAAAPAVADAHTPTAVGAPVVSNLNSTGPLGALTGDRKGGQGRQDGGAKAAGLPVAGGLLGGLPLGG